MPIRRLVLALLLAVSPSASADMFTLFSSGNWSGISNWYQNGLPATRYPGQIPGTIDTVNLTLPFYTVTVDVALTEAVTLTSQCPSNTSTCVIDVTTGDLRLTGASTIGTDARLKIGGGGSVTNEGTLTIANTADLDWTNGTLRGSGQTAVASGGNVNATGASMILNGHGLAVSGLFTYGVSASGFTLHNGANITIESGGVFDIQNVAGIGSNFVSEPWIYVQAGGTLKKTAGNSVADIEPILNNSGVVQVDVSTLDVTGGLHTGDFVMNGPATGIAFSGTPQFFNGSSIQGSGTASIVGTPVIVGVIDATNIAMNGGWLQGTNSGGGVVDVSGTVTFNEGVWRNNLIVNMLPGSTFNFPGVSSAQIRDFAVVNNGAGAVINLNAGPGGFAIDNGGGIVNNGAFNILGDVTITSDHINSARLDNGSTGTLSKTAGAGTASIESLMNNAGTVSVTSGGLRIRGGGNHNGTFSTAAAGTTIGFDGQVNVFMAGSSFAGFGTFALVAGTMDVDGAITVPGTAAFQQSGGTLTGSADFRIDGTFLWMGGQHDNSSGIGRTILGPAATVNATSLIAPIAIDNRTFENGADFTWNGDLHPLSIANGATLNNTGTFTATGGGMVLAPGGGAFNNSGTLQKTGGASPTRIDAFITNSGTINSGVSGQALAISGGGSQTAGGTLSATAGALVDFLGETYTVAGGASPLAGSGTFRVTGGTMAIAGNLSLPAPAVLQLQSGALAVASSMTFYILNEFQWTGGTLQGDGTARVFGGFIGNTAPTSLAGDTTLTIAAASFSYNADSTNHLTVSGTGNLNIESGTTFTMTSNGIIGGAAPAEVTVAGTLVKSGTDLARITVPVNVSGTGQKLISVAGGVLDLAGGGFTVGPIAVTASTSSLRFSGGTFSIDAGASLTGSGALHLAAGTLSVNTPITAEILEISGGVLGGAASIAANGGTWSGGTITGAAPLTLGGNFVINGTNGPTTLDGRTLTNDATLEFVSASNPFALVNGASVDNNATFLARSDAGILGGAGGGTFINDGQFVRDVAGGTLAVDPAFTNTNSTQFFTGTVGFEGGYTQTGGTTELAGGTISSPLTVSIVAGELMGAGPIAADVSNGGRVRPGSSPGTLTINGDFTQTASGVLEIELGGTPAGTGYDVLSVRDNATVDGTLNVVFFGGFAPANGDIFDVVTFATHTGDFAAYTLPAWSGTWVPSYTPTSLRLTAVGLPSTVGLTSSLNPSSVGQSVTFQASLPADAMGSVQFQDNGVDIGTAVPVVSGSAVFTTSTLTAGTHPITAVHSGDAKYSASTSNTVSQVVNTVAAAITLASSANPSFLGQSVTFTLTVPADATGTVQFQDNGVDVGSAASVTSGSAQFSSSTLGVGTHVIAAVYSGDTKYAAATSNSVNQVVTRITPTTALTSSVNPSVFGQPVTFTAIVPADATGTVQFQDGGVDLGAAVPVTAGSVQFTTSTLAVGTHTIAANYSGDPKYDPAVSNAVNQVVGAAGDADLRVTGSVSSTAAILVGSTTMVTFTLTNAGPSSVFNTAFIATMTGGATVSSAAPSQGTCTMTPAISCSLGTLPAGGTATVSLNVTLPATSGPVSFTGTVSSTSPDPDGTSNSATVWLQVLTALQIPTLDPRMLALLAIAFIAVAVRMMR